MENEKQEIADLEAELKKFSPSKTELNRDELFFQAGLATSEKRGPFPKRLRFWQAYSVVMTLTTLVSIGWMGQEMFQKENSTGFQQVNVESPVNPPQKQDENPLKLDFIERETLLPSVGIVSNVSGKTNFKESSYFVLREKLIESLEEGKTLETTFDSNMENSTDQNEPALNKSKSSGSHQELMKELLQSTI